MKKFLSLFAAVLFVGSMMAANLLSIDFTQGQGDWTIDVKANPDQLEYIWTQDAQYGMKASAYVDGNHESEAWLISPAIDMSAVEKATLAFSHARKYGSLDQLSVKVSADGENWADLEVSEWPDGTSWTFVDATADLAAYVGQAAVKIAFVYTSSTTGGATWEIKTVSVNDGGVAPVVIEEITVGAAMALGNALPDNGYTDKKYTVMGYVISAKAHGEKYEGKQTFYMSDDVTAERGEFTAYNCAVAAPGVEVGQFVKVTGKIQKYVYQQSGDVTIEITGGDVEIVWGAAIENVELTEKAQKVMVDGVLYIVRDGKMFDVRGAQVR